MTTRVYSNDSPGVPASVGTQISAPNMDARPRIRRRIPNIQAHLSSPNKSSISKTTSGSSISGSKQPTRVGSGHKALPKPDITSTNHRTWRDATPTRCNSTTSSTPANQRSRRPGSGAQSVSNGGRTEVRGNHVADTEQDVKFIDVEGSSRSDKASRIHTARDTLTINPRDILEKSQAGDCGSVYEIDLHGASVGFIENLEMFKNLRVLDLSCNHIRHIDNLQHNADLRELKLYDNDIDTVENLDKLKELSHLQLQHNRIRSINKGLSSQRKLRTLRLDSNALCRLDVREVASVSLLTSLDLSNNRLDNIAAVSCLTNLEELLVVNNRLRTISDLSRCKKLQEVDVSYNKLADLSGLKDLPNLRILHAAHNQMASLKSIGRIKGLQELNLSHNRLTNTRAITENFPSLQILDISDNHIETWQNICSLDSLRDLVELYIVGNPFCHPDGPMPSYHGDLHKRIPALEILDGAQLKRPASRSGTPLMRPMSAASVLTSRQVETQIRHLDDEMENFEKNLSAQFESLRSTMEYFSSLVPDDGSDTSTQSPDIRPSSKCGKRSRIKLAQEFAAYKYTSTQADAGGERTKDTAERTLSTEERDHYTED